MIAYLKKMKNRTYEILEVADLTRRIKKELSRRKLIPSDVRFTDVVDD